VKVGGEQWTVEDGAIHGVGVTKGYGYLMTEKHYKRFRAGHPLPMRDRRQ
jgi:hypothetical protein